MSIKHKIHISNLLFLLVFILLLGSAFYWFQIRPAKIKHECSWITTHFDKVSAKPSKTAEEVFAESKLNKEDFERALRLARGEVQPKSPVNASGVQNIQTIEDNLQDRRLQSAGQEMLKKMQGSPEMLARDETRRATGEEYSFCLQDKGL